MHLSTLRPILFFLLVLSLGLPQKNTNAQQTAWSRPVDMMIVIDNSCSMFPANQIRANCDAFGSDPEFLRIIGADLFFARLGFDQPDEAAYQIGVVTFGEDPRLVNPLEPIQGNRDSLAGKISNAAAEASTQMLPALMMAYQELAESPNRNPENTPAIVMITDGVPWPREDQPNEAFEKLISDNPDTPVFLMLLQNPARESNDYTSYIDFWKRVQARYSHVFVYPIENAGQIEATYNTILGQLQNTIAGRTVQLSAGQTHSFDIDPFIDKFLVTVIRGNGGSGNHVTITDPDREPVLVDEAGVTVFQGAENPVEVFAISSPRLTEELKGREWTITANSGVRIFVDRVGAYRFSFISPMNEPTEIGNIYRVIERQSPSRNLVVRFSLIDTSGQPVTVPQQISGSIIYPNGAENPLPVLESLIPRSDGIYELSVNVADTYPDILTTPGRFVILLQAGGGDESTGSTQPIANARLIMDMGQTPFIRSIAPLPVICEPNQPFELRVNLEDTSASDPDSLGVRLIYGSDSLLLSQSDTPGQYVGELSGFCTAIIQRQFCSSQEVVSILVQLDATLADGTVLVPVSREIQAQVISPACTPTPLPTFTPTPQPTATPIPDRDNDGLNDLEDRCPGSVGLVSQQGCIPSGWLIGGVSLLGGLILSTVWLLPFVRVRTFGRPPGGYLLICKDGKAQGEIIDLHEMGMKRRRSDLLVGSDFKRCDILVNGLRGIEFLIERKVMLTALREQSEREPFAYLGDDIKIVRTSDPKTVIKASMQRERLKC